MLAHLKSVYFHIFTSLGLLTPPTHILGLFPKKKIDFFWMPSLIFHDNSDVDDDDGNDYVRMKMFLQ